MFNKSTRTNGSEPPPPPHVVTPEPAQPIPLKPEQPRMERPAMNQGMTSIIGADLTIKGNLESNAAVQIDGRVEGDIQSQTVTIGEGAQVDGSIAAETVIIYGNMQGEIKASMVQLMSNARVTGDIIHRSLAVEAGASIEGHLRRMDG